MNHVYGHIEYNVVLEAFNYGHWETSKQEDKPRAIPDTHIVWEPNDEMPPYCPHESCLKMFPSDADPTAFDCRRCLGADFPEGYLSSEQTVTEEK